MVLQGGPCGRVGHRRTSFVKWPPKAGWPFLVNAPTREDQNMADDDPTERPREGDAPRRSSSDRGKGPSRPSTGGRKPYESHRGDNRPPVKRDGDKKPYAPRDGDRKPYPKREGDRSPTHREIATASRTRSAMVTGSRTRRGMATGSRTPSARVIVRRIRNAMVTGSRTHRVTATASRTRSARVTGRRTPSGRAIVLPTVRGMRHPARLAAAPAGRTASPAPTSCAPYGPASTSRSSRMRSTPAI